LLLLAFLFPVAVYLLVLAHLNRRPRATMVPGAWDFAGILLAASGFLLFGGPALLTSLSRNERWRGFWLQGRGGPGLTDEDGLITVRIVLFALYFVAVVVGAGLLLWRRRRTTSIYNVDPAVVEAVLGQTLEHWQVPFVQAGNVLTFEPDADAGQKRPRPSADPLAAYAPGAHLAASPEGNHAPAGVAPPALLDRPVTLEVDVAPSLCHVTLTWDPPDSLLRREVETQLDRALAETPAPASAVGDWMLIVAYALFFLVLLGLTVLALLWFLPR
jgi:hypothetical protein